MGVNFVINLNNLALNKVLCCSRLTSLRLQIRKKYDKIRVKINLGEE